MQTKMN